MTDTPPAADSPAVRAAAGSPPADSPAVRDRIVDALRLDLVGPPAGHALVAERLPGWVRPSNWYLTGFLVPSGLPPERCADADEDDDFETEVPEDAGLAEESGEDRRAAKRGYFPSSMGISFLAPAEAKRLLVTVRWGDYTQAEFEVASGKTERVWARTPREVEVAVPLSDGPVGEAGASGSPDAPVHDVSGSDGLQIHVIVRSLRAAGVASQIPSDARAVSLFLVNRRALPPEGDETDQTFAFQAEIEVRGDRPFLARPDPSGIRIGHEDDWDERVADLHYAGTPEYATGHGVSADWEVLDGACRLVRTAWIPAAEVEKTETVDPPGVELSMETLGALTDGAAVEAALRPLSASYREWIEARRNGIGALDGGRRDIAEELLRSADVAAGRMERGIAALAGDDAVLDAFRVANRTVARALRQRLDIEAPRWRAFQLAFIRRDACFARVVSAAERPARRYLGMAASGRNPKVLMRRVLVPLMAAAERAYRDAGGHRNRENPADPYMTVLAYFNSLRELGGGRRIVEEEVQNTLKEYGARRRIGEPHGVFRDRRSFSEVVELTSRVSTNRVAEARRRLDRRFHEPDRVDCAIATNMISVGLDIQRLGLMVVLGQPKSHAEYIQATSRVGRDDRRPGLVLTLLNVHKPRDRSHYERFRHYHETFYRSVEAGSVTPFAARALDRGFAGALVAYARHGDHVLTPSRGAERIGDAGADLELRLVDSFLGRVHVQPVDDVERGEILRSVRSRVDGLLDAWRVIVDGYRDHGVAVQYQKYEERQPRPLLREMLDSEFESENHRRFRANRSLRDVEPEVNLFLEDLNDDMGNSGGDA